MMQNTLPDSDLLMRGLVEQTLAGIYLIQEGRFRYVNPEFARIFGYASPEDIIDVLPMTDLIAPEDRDRVIENVRRRASGEVQEMRYEFVGMRQDGTRIHVEVHGRRLEFNGVPAVIGLILDVSARRQAERAKGNFLSVVGHELRTPLHHIKSFAGLLSADVEGERGRLRLSKLYQATARLHTLIEAVLDFSRLETGRTTVAEQDFDLPTLIGEARDKIAEAAARKGMAVTTRIAERCPQALRGDRARIGQALDCLLSNAEKFSERDDIEIRADALPSGAAGLRLRIEVEDHGSGVDSAIEANLFDLFQQGDASDTRAHGGLGLGLALCKRLMTVLGGEVGFTSRPGEGSTFWIECPVARPERTVR